MYKEALKIIKDIDPNLYNEKYLTGSYVITKKKEYKDIDFLLWTDNKKKLEDELKLFEFELCGKEGYPYSNVTAYRKGPCNAIIVTDFKVFLRWKAATLLATNMKLVEKADRVELFNIIINEPKKTRTANKIKPQVAPPKAVFNRAWIDERIQNIRLNPNDVLQPNAFAVGPGVRNVVDDIEF